MMTGQQIKDEKRRIEEEKRRIEVEKRRIEEEKHRIEVEKLKIEHKKCSIEREKRKIEDEKRRIEDEKCRIEDEKRRAAMKELIKTAKIYYNSCSSAVKDAAKKFFEDIDHDKDGKVSLHEFLEFMEQEGHKKMSSRNFFETLVRKGSGTLNFTEVLAIFYIIQSGRPFCRRCNVFIAGMYFTCSECHESDSYDVIFLCPDCFENGSHTHRHGRRQFLDNYALLALKRKQRIDRAARHSKQVQGTPSKGVPSTSTSTSTTTKAIVPYVPTHHCKHKWKPKFEKFLQALQAAGFIAHSIVSLSPIGCTIM